MARSSKQSNPARESGSKAATPQEKSAQKGRKPKPQAAEAPVQKEALIGSNARRDIAGVAFIVLGVVLFVCAAFPSDAMVSNGLSVGLHYAFGIGAYLVPLALVIVGACFLVRFGRERVPLRATIGLALILLAVLIMLSLFTPGASDANAGEVLNPAKFTMLGGLLGGGFAWVGLQFLGQAVSCVILLGLIVVGMVIIGLSLSGIIEHLREKYGNPRGELDPRVNMLDRPQARIVRQEPLPMEQGAQPAAAPQAQLSAAPTAVIENAPTLREKLAGKMGKRNSRKLAAAPEPEYEYEYEPGEEQPTQVLPQDRVKSKPAPTPRKRAGNSVDFAPKKRNSQPLEDEQPLAQAAGTAAAQGAAQAAAPAQNTRKTLDFAAAGAAGAATQMTRKLGGNGAATQTMPAVDRKRKPSTPMATPRPDNDFELPPMNLLATRKTVDGGGGEISQEELQETAETLQTTLEDFGIMAQVAGWVAGPTVTLFKVSLPAGVRVSRITALNDDIALALAAPGVRIFAPIPGTNYVGIEIPNKSRRTVFLGDVLQKAKGGPLEVAIGEDVEGNLIVSDLAKMPHLLIAGTTGSGKSVSINAMIMSILMRATPSQVRFIMVDPKRVEFTPYNGIPHLYVPVVTEPKDASSALAWGVAEMEKRLKDFSKIGVRNIGQYNAKVQSMEAEEGEESPGELPYIVIIIDELADLMMNVGKEVEFSISRIAQLARAAGIHLIVATQRPSANVVTGLIKSNITNRISFNVASSIDSRVILDTPGAENLIGNGDLLLSKPEFAKPQRIQGCYVSEDEIFDVVSRLKEQGEPEYHTEILKTNLVTLGDSDPNGGGGSCEDDDPLIWEAAEIVVSSNLGSTSNLQRRLKVGYARAGRIMDMLEDKGIVGPANGSKPRDVLVDAMELETLKAFEQND
ncbi:MAG: DNA translocase FtsK 4TM domain-containing protein [Coriobacteriia bacterium]|nr:DNA translocase FtsK 4TM domain-containing protein [Coriobacteriia bacterium]